MHPSIFNNVIGPVMRGPSSSHTAASVRIGLLGLKLLGEQPVKAIFRFDPQGSLATTYRGQGSAMGLAAGLLGMEITNPDLVNSEEICKNKGIDIEYIIEDYGAEHPNNYRVELSGGSGKKLSFNAASTGGGIISLLDIDDVPLEDDLDYINPLMPVQITRNPDLPFNNIKELSDILIKEEGNLSDYALKYEAALGGLSEDEVFALAVSHFGIMRNAFETGLAGTDYNDRILHRQSHLISELPKKGNLVPGSLTNKIIQSVSAMMETKSAMGVIVAAPTAGASGALGGVLIPVAELTGKTENECARAILAAGLLGVFIAQKGGFAAEEGGCQYECGSASGMAAAALVELMGGDAVMCLNAGSMALQNTIGMICDPVADRVEVPCLGKNIMASLNALAAANMTIAGYDHVVPLEEVINAMQEVGNAMDHKYRCTCKGGLSVTPASLKIHKKLRNK